MSRLGSNRVLLSAKHGVNPSVMLCFFCCKSKGVALVGRLPDDREAPRQAVYDQEPCSDCQEIMKHAIILISVRDDVKDGDQNPYRTGGWVGVTEDFIRRVVTPDAMVDFILSKRMSFIPDSVWKMMGLPEYGTRIEGVPDGIDEFRKAKEQASGHQSPTDGAGT